MGKKPLISQLERYYITICKNKKAPMPALLRLAPAPTGQAQVGAAPSASLGATPKRQLGDNQQRPPPPAVPGATAEPLPPAPATALTTGATLTPEALQAVQSLLQVFAGQQLPPPATQPQTPPQHLPLPSQQQQAPQAETASAQLGSGLSKGQRKRHNRRLAKEAQREVGTTSDTAPVPAATPAKEAWGSKRPRVDTPS